MATWTWHQGHTLDVLRTMADASVHCAITSPPYLGLRDYGLIGRVWDGEAGCAHVWGEERRVTVGRHDENPADLQRRFEAYGSGRPKASTNGNHGGTVPTGAFCQRCGAWKGNLGLEPTPELYIAHLVAIFREVRRVLRDDGTLWLVLGDSYAGGGRGQEGQGAGTKQRSNRGSMTLAPSAVPPGLKPKDLVGIPWRVALALQADGWTLRSDVIEEVELYCPGGCGYVLEERIWRWSQDRDLIWHKPNVMPESVTDRPTKSHEYVFLLTKGESYFYDGEAIKERAVSHVRAREKGNGESAVDTKSRGFGSHCGTYDGGRTKRSVWRVATTPYKDAHFAVFPPKLITPMIRAGTSELGVCAACGAPWRRVVARQTPENFGRGTQAWTQGSAGHHPQRNSHGPTGNGLGVKPRTTIGWQPTCRCEATDRKPAVILDPFAGSGTTLAVAVQLGRDALGIDLNPINRGLAAQRLRGYPEATDGAAG